MQWSACKAYRNRTAASMFIDSIASVIRKRVVDDIKTAEFFFLLRLIVLLMYQ